MVHILFSLLVPPLSCTEHNYLMRNTYTVQERKAPLDRITAIIFTEGQGNLKDRTEKTVHGRKILLLIKKKPIMNNTGFTSTWFSNKEQDLIIWKKKHNIKQNLLYIFWVKDGGLSQDLILVDESLSCVCLWMPAVTFGLNGRSFLAVEWVAWTRKVEAALHVLSIIMEEQQKPAFVPT